MTDHPGLPTLFDRFFDDAAVFPPGRAPLDRAVSVHVERCSKALGRSVGPLLLTPDHLDEAARLHGTSETEVPLRVGVIVSPGGLTEALAVIDRMLPSVQVTGVELKTHDTAVDIENTVTAATALADRFDVHVEMSADRVRDGAVSLLTGSPVRLKARMGGLVASAFPSVDDVATVIRAAVTAGTSFKLTAGLHRAVRYTDATTGFDHHGFLNIAAATAAALDGADDDALTSILTEGNGEILTERFRSLDTNWRSTFESFGTCSIAEPIHTLAELGLAPAITT